MTRTNNRQSALGEQESITGAIHNGRSISLEMLLQPLWIVLIATAEHPEPFVKPLFNGNRHACAPCQQGFHPLGANWSESLIQSRLLFLAEQIRRFPSLADQPREHFVIFADIERLDPGIVRWSKMSAKQQDGLCILSNQFCCHSKTP